MMRLSCYQQAYACKRLGTGTCQARERTAWTRARACTADVGAAALRATCLQHQQARNTRLHRPASAPHRDAQAILQVIPVRPCRVRNSCCCPHTHPQLVLLQQQEAQRVRRHSGGVLQRRQVLDNGVAQALW